MMSRFSTGPGKHRSAGANPATVPTRRIAGSPEVRTRATPLKTAKALGLTVPDRLLALAGSSIRPLPTEQRTVGVCNEAKLGGVASYDAGGMLQRPPLLAINKPFQGRSAVLLSPSFRPMPEGYIHCSAALLLCGKGENRG
jgi:hypothetical protein